MVHWEIYYNNNIKGHRKSASLAPQTPECAGLLEFYCERLDIQIVRNKYDSPKVSADKVLLTIQVPC